MSGCELASCLVEMTEGDAHLTLEVIDVLQS